MFCNRCGVKINEGSQYCDHCQETVALENQSQEQAQNENRISQQTRGRLIALIWLCGSLLLCTIIILIALYISQYSVTRNGNRLTLETHVFGSKKSEFNIKESYSFTGNLFYNDYRGLMSFGTYGPSYAFLLMNRSAFDQLIKDYKREGPTYIGGKLNIDRCKSSGFINANHSLVLLISTDLAFKDKIESLRLYEGMPISITGKKIVPLYEESNGKWKESTGGNDYILVESIKSDKKSITFN